jgi:DNA-directed RNA polymerase specialized sigma24 family protein
MGSVWPQTMTGGTNCPAAYEAEDLLRKVAVADARRAISVAHREILNETILRGRTVNEAAAAIGLPVGTVKSRVYYALRAPAPPASRDDEGAAAKKGS